MGLENACSLWVLGSWGADNFISFRTCHVLGIESRRADRACS